MIGDSGRATVPGRRNIANRERSLPHATRRSGTTALPCHGSDSIPGGLKPPLPKYRCSNTNDIGALFDSDSEVI